MKLEVYNIEKIKGIMIMSFLPISFQSSAILANKFSHLPVHNATNEKYLE